MKKSKILLSWFAPIFVLLIMAGANLQSQNRHEIKFLNGFDGQNVVVNQPFTYDFDAVSEQSGDIHYKATLYTPDDSMSNTEVAIDSITGVVNWTPTSIGVYYISVIAYFVENPQIQAFTYLPVHVWENSEYFTPCAEINGTITRGDNNEPVSDVSVIAVRTEHKQDFENYYESITDANGYYLINVPKGSYFVYVKAYGYLPGFWHSENNPNQPDSIVIECQGVFTANIVLDKDEHVPSTIYFKNYPEEINITKGQTYTFDGEAEDVNGGTVLYKFDEAPDGATVDQATGLVQWTPGLDIEDGNYQFLLQAYLESDENNNSKLYWEVYVGEVEDLTPCAEIKGTLTRFDNNNPVSEATVFAIKLNHNRKDKDSYFEGTSDADGNYSINVPKGNYYLYVKAYGYFPGYYQNLNNPNQPDTVTIECQEVFTADFKLVPDSTVPSTIYFTNYPEGKEIAKGQLYSFDADAEDVNGGDVKYKLETAPEGATIDEMTGLVQWTPGIEIQDGYYPFLIVAYLASDEQNFSKLYWEIFVGNHEEITPCAIINGTVKNESGNPIKDAFVWPIGNDSLFNRKGMHNCMFPSITDENGNFELFLPKGDYILYVEKYDNIIPEFYQDTQNPDEATVLSINCNDTVTISINVAIPEPPTYYNVSGTVVDENTNNPVQAIVQFYPMDPIYFHDPTFQASTETNSDGTFTMSLPGGINYKAAAYPIDMNYKDEFYDNVEDWTEATDIIFNQDISNINFTLSLKPVYNNKISGLVKDEDGNNLNAMVIAYGINSFMSGHGEYSYSVPTDPINTGQYTINNLPPDDYVLLALPNSHKIIPGFYKENDIAVFDWEQATRITMGETSIVDNIIFTLQKADSTRGLAKLQGYVGSNGVSINLKSNTPQGGEGLPGAIIATINQNNKVVGYAITDKSGEYLVDHLSVEKYNVIACKFGFETFKTSIEFNQSGFVVEEKNINLNSKSATGVDDQTNSEYAANIYPNPASANMRIEFSGQLGSGKLMVYNIYGEKALTNNVDISEGNNIINLDVSNFATGTYWLKIEGKSVFVWQSFNVVK